MLRIQHGRWVYLIIDIYVNTIPKFVFVFSFLSYIVPIIFLVSCLRLNNYIWGEYFTIYFFAYYFFVVLSSSLDNSNLEENENKFDLGIFRVIYLKHKTTETLPVERKQFGLLRFDTKYFKHMTAIYFYSVFFLLHLNLKFFKNEFNIPFVQYKNQNEICGHAFQIFFVTFMKTHAYTIREK